MIILKVYLVFWLAICWWVIELVAKWIKADSMARNFLLIFGLIIALFLPFWSYMPTKYKMADYCKGHDVGVHLYKSAYNVDAYYFDSKGAAKWGYFEEGERIRISKSGFKSPDKEYYLSRTLGNKVSEYVSESRLPKTNYKYIKNIKVMDGLLEINRMQVDIVDVRDGSLMAQYVDYYRDYSGQDFFDGFRPSVVFGNLSYSYCEEPLAASKSVKNMTGIRDRA